MLFTSSRPNGSRLARGSFVKLKCIELTATEANGGAWGNGVWGTGWSPTRLAAQLAQIKSLGANCVKIGTGTVSSSDVADATMRPNMRAFWQMCRNNGLVAYVVMQGCGQCTGTDPTAANAYGLSVATNVAYQCKVLSWLQADAPDVIVGVDLANEFNNYGNQTSWGVPVYDVNLGKYWSTTTQWISDCSYFMNQARQACSFPLTMSVFMLNNAGAYSAGTAIAVQNKISCDFHDVHPYYNQSTGGVTSSMTLPQGIDLAALEGNAAYLGQSFIGEIGVPTNSDAGIINSFISGLGDMARRPKCRGVSYLGLTDISGFPAGMYPDGDTAFASPRNTLITPFKNWPASI